MKAQIQVGTEAFLYTTLRGKTFQAVVCACRTDPALMADTEKRMLPSFELCYQGSFLHPRWAWPGPLVLLPAEEAGCPIWAQLEFWYTLSLEALQDTSPPRTLHGDRLGFPASQKSSSKLRYAGAIHQTQAVQSAEKSSDYKGGSCHFGSPPSLM